eukprot:355782-Chlamydomonas_euryale.AAC.1
MPTVNGQQSAASPKMSTVNGQRPTISGIPQNVNGERSTVGGVPERRSEHPGHARSGRGCIVSSATTTLVRLMPAGEGQGKGVLAESICARAPARSCPSSVGGRKWLALSCWNTVPQPQ